MSATIMAYAAVAYTAYNIYQGGQQLRMQNAALQQQKRDSEAAQANMLKQEKMQEQELNAQRARRASAAAENSRRQQRATGKGSQSSTLLTGAGGAELPSMGRRTLLGG